MKNKMKEQNERTISRDGKKWLILMKLILKNTSYEGSFITKILKITVKPWNWSTKYLEHPVQWNSFSWDRICLIDFILVSLNN